VQVRPKTARASGTRSGHSNRHALFNQETPMKVATLACSAVLSMFTVLATAQDAMKKDAMKDGAMNKDMSMQQCKDHMAMAKKDGMKKDDASMKKDAMCADMMKKDEMKKDDAMMKKGGTATDPVKR
jgi:pentapeptide MXKDX repeat protein